MDDNSHQQIERLFEATILQAISDRDEKFFRSPQFVAIAEFCGLRSKLIQKAIATKGIATFSERLRMTKCQFRFGPRKEGSKNAMSIM